MWWSRKKEAALTNGPVDPAPCDGVRWHSEEHYGVATGRVISVACDCELGHDHTFAEPFLPAP